MANLACPSQHPEVFPGERGVRHRELSVWSKVKAILRKLKARTYQDLVDGIVQAMLAVTKEDIRNWFAHCCYCAS